MTKINIPPLQVLSDRQDEIKKIEHRLQKLSESSGSITFISGEAGIGKSRLIYEAAKKAENMKISTYLGKCSHTLLSSLHPFIDAFATITPNPINVFIRSPKINAIYLTGPSGLLITKAERLNSKIESSLLTSMYEIIQDFVYRSVPETVNDNNPYKITGIDRENIRIFSIRKDKLGLIFLLDGRENQLLEEDAKELIDIIEKRYKNDLDNWVGDITRLKNSEELLSKMINMPQYNGQNWDVDSKGVRKDFLYTHLYAKIRDIAKKEQILLCLDDLQWADETSLRLLLFLGERISNLPIMIIGTYRREEIFENDLLTGVVSELQKEQYVDIINLDSLTYENSLTLINALLNRTVEKDIEDQLYHESEGNPFFLIELCKLYQEEGHLTKSFDNKTIPQKIYDIVKLRIQKLSDSERDVLETAAIVGQEFNLYDLTILLPNSKVELARTLKKLMDKQVIREQRDHYRFFHTKIRDVILAEIPAEIKQELHRKYAETLENNKEINDMEKYFKLAYHYMESRDMTKGINIVMKAGEIARSQYSIPEAIQLYKRVLKEDLDHEKKYMVLNRLIDAYEYSDMWMDALKTTKEALILVPLLNRKEEIAKITLKQGDIYIAMGDPENAIQKYRDALEYSTEYKERDLIARSLRGLGYTSWKSGNLQEAMKFYKDSMKYANELQDRYLMATLQIDTGNIYFTAGNIAGAAEHYNRCIEMLIPMGDSAELGRAYNNLGTIYLELSEWDKALEMFEKQATISSRIGKSDLLAWALFQKAYCNVMLNNVEAAKLDNNRSYNIGTWLGDKVVVGISRIIEGYIIYKSENNIEKAMDVAKKGLKIISEIKSPPTTASSLAMVARLASMANIEESRDLYSKALDIYRSIGDNFHIAVISRILSTNVTSGS